MGVKTVRLAFDMDLLSKAHVAKALDECAAGLLDADFAIEFERWPEQFKGIDDALAGGAELEVVGADEARVVIGKIVTTVTKSADLPHVLRGELYGEPKATVEEEDD
jgi:hypothetical protein